MTSKEEFRNIMYVKEMTVEIMDAINAADIDRIREIKGELKAMDQVVSPIEKCMGTILGAMVEYQRKTQKFKIQMEEDLNNEEEEVEKVSKKKNGNSH